MPMMASRRAMRFVQFDCIGGDVRDNRVNAHAESIGPPMEEVKERLSGFRMMASSTVSLEQGVTANGFVL